MKRSLLIATCAGATALMLVPAASAQSFGLDDNPFAPLTGPPGVIPGFGAENPFGWLVGPWFPPGVAPSPTLGAIGCLDGDILGFGPAIQLPPPIGVYNASLTNRTLDRGYPIRIHFSVDRLSAGAPGTAVAWQSGLNQQPGDIYRSVAIFVNPGAFAGIGSPAGAPYGGPLPALIAGPPMNRLLIDESIPGLQCAGVLMPPNMMAGPIAMGTHDNIDAFDTQTFDPDGDGLNNVWEYFTLYPDEALIIMPPVTPADIFDVAPGAVVTPPMPFAPALQMGLMPGQDSIDALVLYDFGAFGGPASGGPGAEPWIDYALFSLAPGSASLAQWGLASDDIFFTDFNGQFFLYAPAPLVGLAGLPFGEPGTGDNIDALEVSCNVDVDGNGVVDVNDMLAVLASWGPALPFDPADTDLNGVVDVNDLLAVLGAWGPCT